MSASGDKPVVTRPPWVPAGRFDELCQSTFDSAERDQYRRRLERSRGLRFSGAVAVLVGLVTFFVALWFKEGGFVITMTIALTAVGIFAMRPRHTSPAEVRRLAEANLERALEQYRHEQLAQHDFYHSEAWQALRRSTLENSDARCVRCGRKASAMLVVEHIQSRSQAPQLALDPTNVQIICHACRNVQSARTGSD